MRLYFFNRFAPSASALSAMNMGWVRSSARARWVRGGPAVSCRGEVLCLLVDVYPQQVSGVSRGGILHMGWGPPSARAGGVRGDGTPPRQIQHTLITFSLSSRMHSHLYTRMRTYVQTHMSSHMGMHTYAGVSRRGGPCWKAHRVVFLGNISFRGPAGDSAPHGCFPDHVVSCTSTATVVPAE